MITRHDVVYILNYISVLLLFLPICMVHVSFSFLINANSFCVKVEAIINCKFYFIKFIAPIVYTTSSLGGSYNFFLVLSAIFRTKFVKVFFIASLIVPEFEWYSRMHFLTKNFRAAFEKYMENKEGG